MDIDLAVDQLVGPVYYRVLITGQPVPPEFTDALVDQYLAHAASSKALPGYCRTPCSPATPPIAQGQGSSRSTWTDG